MEALRHPEGVPAINVEGSEEDPREPFLSDHAPPPRSPGRAPRLSQREHQRKIADLASAGGTRGAARKARAAAMQDLATRTVLFRNRLIEEFQILESSTELDTTSKTAPQYTTRDIIMEPELFKNILRETPQQLIKFKLFKRTADMVERKKKQARADRRLARVKNINSVPIGVWANWVVNHPVFTTLMIILILINGVLLGVAAETPDEDYKAHRIMTVMDNLILIAFALEIVLKWLDNFHDFWNDGWNVFDFVVTTSSAIPELLILTMGTNAKDSATVAKIARQMRIFRTLRSFKMVVRFRNLRIIVQTILEAFQSLGNILFLLAIIMYIYAVIGINIFEAYTISSMPGLKYKKKFSDLWNSFMTLFQLLTLDQWYNMYRDYTKVVPGITTLLFYITWVWLGAFVFRNIFVGVMVRNFQNIAAALTRADDETLKRRKIARLWKKVHQQMKEAKMMKSAMQAAAKAIAQDEGGKEANGNSSNDILKAAEKTSKREKETKSPHSGSNSNGSSSNGLTGQSAGSLPGRVESQREKERERRLDGESPTTSTTASMKDIRKEMDSDSVDTTVVLTHGETSSVATDHVTEKKPLKSALSQRSMITAQYEEEELNRDREGRPFVRSPSARSVRSTTNKLRREKDGELSRYGSFRSVDSDDRTTATTGTRTTGANDEEIVAYDSMLIDTITSLKTKKVETLWPRDTLFKYFQTMERLQENLREYQELQLLSAWTLYDLHDT
eukprot:TRINITY_DN8580_c0_g1::TRINITY_DN8580_c0_g1_i1::g.8615::m.8615 TRINITY_DN8580_c0_g1::TRINITY_DN8580_c0_g1_i1::g.8615  ORF type:complete len:733 (+),score=135.83,sp/A2ARP9/CTSR2_MOUSE/35.24/1e-54,Ion_trans/PF00520.26/2.2e-29,RhoGAP/PF00620.22/0.035,RhoGAP/PF00620.22/1e+03,DUF1018/PF06252.7/12,DUF1018/PF06252.7/8.2 TRINITY_DN8580_c0_g1_i1:22-2220(+)